MSRESWESWKMAVWACIEGQGLSPLPLSAYVASPIIPVDNLTDEVRRMYRKHKTKIQSLWFLPEQATRGSQVRVLPEEDRSAGGVSAKGT